MKYYIIKDYCLYLKSFETSLSVGTIIILWLSTLIIIKLKSLSDENTISQASKKILGPISRAVMSI